MFLQLPLVEVALWEMMDYLGDIQKQLAHKSNAINALVEDYLKSREGTLTVELNLLFKRQYMWGCALVGWGAFWSY